MHRPITRLLAVLAALALTTAACGGGDDQIAEDVVDADVGEVPDEELIDEAASELGEECAFVGVFAGSELGEDFQGAFDPESTLGGADADVGGAMATVGAQFREAADLAPEEISDDLATMAEAFSSAASELDGADLDVTDPEDIAPEDFEAFQRLEEVFDADFEEAATAVETYVGENCQG